MIVAVPITVNDIPYSYGTVYPHIVAESRLEALVEAISCASERAHGKAVLVLRCEKRAKPQEDPRRVSP